MYQKNVWVSSKRLSSYLKEVFMSFELGYIIKKVKFAFLKINTFITDGLVQSTVLFKHQHCIKIVTQEPVNSGKFLDF